MVGVRNGHGFGLESRGRIQIYFLTIHRSVTHNIHVIYNSLEHHTALGHHGRDRRNPREHPLHERFEISGLIDALRSKIVKTGKGLILGQQMHNTVRPALLANCPNMVRNRSAGDVFTHLLQLVSDILSYHCNEAAELIRSGERAIQLILVNSVIVLIDIRTIKVGFKNLRLALDLLINCQTVAVRRIFALGVRHRVLIAIIVYKFTVSNRQLANTIAKGDLIHHDAVKFPAIRPDGENGAGQHLRNGFHQRVIAGLKSGLCRSDKARAVYRRDGCGSGCLALNRIQNCRCLGKSKIVCH